MADTEYHDLLLARLGARLTARANPSEPAEPESQEDEVNTTSFLRVLLGDEGFLIPVRFVDEVVRIDELTLVPRVPEQVRGVFQRRGMLIPLLDTRAAVSRTVAVGKRESAPARAIAVVVSRDVASIGLQVTEVEGIVEVLPAERGTPPGEAFRYVATTARVGGDLVGIIDVERLLELKTGDLTPPVPES